MTVVDFEALVESGHAGSVLAPSGHGNHVVSSSMLRTPSENDKPGGSFPLRCVRDVQAVAPSTRMMTDSKGTPYVLLTLPDFDKPRTGDDSPTLPQIRRDAIRFGTSFSLELLRREALNASNKGETVVLNYHLASRIASRLNVSERDRDQVRLEMESELRDVNRRQRILAERNRLNISKLDHFFDKTSS